MTFAFQHVISLNQYGKAGVEARDALASGSRDANWPGSVENMFWVPRQWVDYGEDEVCRRRPNARSLNPLMELSTPT